MKFAEIANGRAAMFGCAVLALVAITNKLNLIENLDLVNLQSIWLDIGVYAG
tara:strand:+ start:730 stop:885 length:156 start_codon:yes stop_codon:yes gene_type:complete